MPEEKSYHISTFFSPFRMHFCAHMGLQYWIGSTENESKMLCRKKKQKSKSEKEIGIKCEEGIIEN